MARKSMKTREHLEGEAYRLGQLIYQYDDNMKNIKELVESLKQSLLGSENAQEEIFNQFESYVLLTGDFLKALEGFRIFIETYIREATTIIGGHHPPSCPCPPCMAARAKRRNLLNY